VSRWRRASIIVLSNLKIILPKDKEDFIPGVTKTRKRPHKESEIVLDADISGKMQKRSRIELPQQMKVRIGIRRDVLTPEFMSS
jgi:hypothetical protein